MNKIIIGAMFLATTSCAVTYVPPTAKASVNTKTLSASKNKILSAAKKVLINEGFQITAYDDSAGIISTAAIDQKLTPAQADCGTTMGIDYLKDNRTSTRVAYGVIVDGNNLIIKTTITGEYKPGTVSQDITLTCISRGQLGRELLNKIANNI